MRIPTYHQNSSENSAEGLQQSKGAQPGGPNQGRYPNSSCVVAAQESHHSPSFGASVEHPKAMVEGEAGAKGDCEAGPACQYRRGILSTQSHHWIT